MIHAIHGNGECGTALNGNLAEVQGCVVPLGENAAGGGIFRGEVAQEQSAANGTGGGDRTLERAAGDRAGSADAVRSGESAGFCQCNAGIGDGQSPVLILPAIAVGDGILTVLGALRIQIIAVGFKGQFKPALVQNNVTVRSETVEPIFCGGSARRAVIVFQGDAVDVIHCAARSRLDENLSTGGGPCLRSFALNQGVDIRAQNRGLRDVGRINTIDLYAVIHKRRCVLRQEELTADRAVFRKIRDSFCEYTGPEGHGRCKVACDVRSIETAELDPIVVGDRSVERAAGNRTVVRNGTVEGAAGQMITVVSGIVER